MSFQTLRRVRRVMVVGLILTVLGNRLIEGGWNALTAAGQVSVGTFVLISSAEQLCVFAFPLYAHILKKYSPDTTLITVDFIEALLSVVAVVALMFTGIPGTWLLIGYIAIDLFLAPVSDIAEEFYGAAFAQQSEEHALSFNAALYAWLGFIGLVVASPAGAWVSVLSVQVLFIANAVLSLAGASFRMWARHTYAMPALIDADDEEFSATGARLPIRQFFFDLFRSGPASPLLSFVLQVIGALTGSLVFLWAANLSDRSAQVAMGWVLIAFGSAATVGPLVGRRISKAIPTKRALQVTAGLSATNIVIAVVLMTSGNAHFYTAIGFIFFNVLFNKARVIILETHRQVFFRGSQFARIMSWSYSFGAVGTICGLQLGYLLNTPDSPLSALLIAASLWVVVAGVVSSHSCKPSTT
ncbi:MFS transporter [Arcanobacterium buesumense]|uniref:MFS transporter n=1 Tax=Arcanobacterium buesumense TaxID=2722751 RepID=A0A6H2EKK5_9ACTO|nr:MFS transporter [Arcanobacterium buesumense]QJC21172.1 MFS transporter [Arcanobacterium buesumense]